MQSLIRIYPSLGLRGDGFSGGWSVSSFLRPAYRSFEFDFVLVGLEGAGTVGGVFEPARIWIFLRIPFLTLPLGLPPRERHSSWTLISETACTFLASSFFFSRP